MKYGADYGLDKLATAGTRLKSVLLYHISPNGSLTLDQLGAAGNLTTVLGQDLNASYPLLAGVNSTNGVSDSPVNINPTNGVSDSHVYRNSRVQMNGKYIPMC